VHLPDSESYCIRADSNVKNYFNRVSWRRGGGPLTGELE
jgi:hypothetical protein